MQIFFRRNKVRTKPPVVRIVISADEAEHMEIQRDLETHIGLTMVDGWVTVFNASQCSDRHPFTWQPRVASEKQGSYDFSMRWSSFNAAVNGLFPFPWAGANANRSDLIGGFVRVSQVTLRNDQLPFLQSDECVHGLYIWPGHMPLKPHGYEEKEPIDLNVAKLPFEEQPLESRLDLVKRKRDELQEALSHVIGDGIEVDIGRDRDGNFERIVIRRKIEL